MVSVTLPRGISGVEGLPRARESITNLMPGLLSRPGVSSYATGSGACRGLFQFKGVLYAISGSELRSVSEGFTSSKGLVSGLGSVDVAVDHAAAALVSGNTYTFDGNSVTASNLGAMREVSQVDSIFVYVPMDGGPALFSEPGEPGNVLPASFFDAESLPDVNTGTFALSSDLYIGGEETIEIFRHTGPATAPFVRVLGGQIPVGYWGGKVRYQRSIAFLGNDNGPGFYRIFQAQQEKISTPEVDEILSTYSQEEMQLCKGMRFTWHGQDVLVFRLPRHTFGYSGTWFYLASGDENETWRVNAIERVGDRYIVGDAQTSEIGCLAKTSKEFGGTFQRELTTFVRTEKPFRARQLKVESVSQVEGEGTLGLRLSKDGLIYTEEMRRALPKIGKGQSQVVFGGPGGLGHYPSLMGIKLRTAEAVDFSTDVLWVDV